MLWPRSPPHRLCLQLLTWKVTRIDYFHVHPKKCTPKFHSLETFNYMWTILKYQTIPNCTELYCRMAECIFFDLEPSSCKMAFENGRRVNDAANFWPLCLMLVAANVSTCDAVFEGFWSPKWVMGQSKLDLLGTSWLSAKSKQPWTPESSSDFNTPCWLLHKHHLFLFQKDNCLQILANFARLFSHRIRHSLAVPP